MAPKFSFRFATVLRFAQKALTFVTYWEQRVQDQTMRGVKPFLEATLDIFIQPTNPRSCLSRPMYEFTSMKSIYTKKEGNNNKHSFVHACLCVCTELINELRYLSFVL